MKTPPTAITVATIQQVANNSPTMVASDVIILAAKLLQQPPLLVLQSIGGFSGLAKITGKTNHV